MSIIWITKMFRRLLSNQRPLIDSYKKVFVAFVAALFLLPLSGCAEDTASVEMTGLNYTNEYIAVYTVNGYGVANVDAYSGGGGFVCCVKIPKRWRPGLKATVRWTKDDRTDDFWKQKEVDIPEYKEDDLGQIAVHFFPNDEVKVLVSMITVGHPKYPYPDPKSGR